MKKEKIITRKEEFSFIIKTGKFVSEKVLVLYFYPKALTNSRVGITVSKKLGNAVQRNKAKRQLKSMVDSIYNWQEDFDTIIIIREMFKISSFDDNKKHLESAYKKVKIKCERQGISK